LYNDRSHDETWVHLSDGSILSYDFFSSIASGVPGQAQRYVASQNRWVDAGSVPVALSSPAVGYQQPRRQRHVLGRRRARGQQPGRPAQRSSHATPPPR
jgi:hypothetical protein